MQENEIIQVGDIILYAFIKDRAYGLIYEIGPSFGTNSEWYKACWFSIILGSDTVNSRISREISSKFYHRSHLWEYSEVIFATK